MWTAMLFGDVMSPSIVVIAASIAPSIARTLASPVIEESKKGSITSVDASAGRERPSNAIAATIEATICKFIDAKLWLRVLPPLDCVMSIPKIQTTKQACEDYNNFCD